MAVIKSLRESASLCSLRRLCSRHLPGWLPLEKMLVPCELWLRKITKEQVGAGEGQGEPLTG